VARRVTDDELLSMLQQAEEPVVAEAIGEDPAETGRDPCSFCGEPAEHVGECLLCREAGCLPPDLWTPGMGEPCLTLCVRCGREIHLACAVEDEAGNPRCPTCPF
jgi:hypothetical protein